MVMILSWLQPQLLGVLGIFLYNTHVALALDLDLGNTGMFRFGPCPEDHPPSSRLLVLILDSLG